jgi:Na+/H+-dicarboxylate symporter/ABC-type amino acid transport substrate-binding protein
MRFSHQVLAGLGLGILVGLFLGEAVAPLGPLASSFVRLLQMTVLPYVTLSIVVNLGTLTYGQARALAVGAGSVLAAIWATALGFAFLFPLALPDIDTASFYSPAPPDRDAFNFLDLYVPANPFHSLANNVVPAVVLFSVMTGLALIGVEHKQPLLDVLRTASTAIARVARFIVRLTPFGIFAIAANAAGTLDVDQLHRIEVYLVAYAAFALLLALWVLPGLVSVLMPINAREMLGEARDALLTAFLVGDLLVVLPALVEACSALIRRHVDPSPQVAELPGSIVPTTFTFPHAGKLLSITFILFAGWFSDSEVPVARYPQLAGSGFFSLFGSLNAAVPFLLDLFRIPADTFQLFLATGVVNSRFGTLVAGVHTVAVGLLGSAAIAGRLDFNPARLLRFFVSTAVLTAAIVLGLRAGFATFLDAAADGRDAVNALQPIASEPVDDSQVRAPADLPDTAPPAPGGVLAAIYQRQTLRVGVGDTMPYAFRNDRGQLVGFDVEMAQQLAGDLGVRAEFVRVDQADVEAAIGRRTVDIVMSGARLTPERAAMLAFSEPYLDETLAVVVPDHERGRFASWTAIRELGPIPIGIQDLPYYVAVIRGLVPAAELRVVPTTGEVLAVDDGIDVYILPAERASVLTMLNPQYSVVVPQGVQVKMPLAYPLAGDDAAWGRYVDTWIGLKRRDGFIDRLYDHWILGRSEQRRRPRWSIGKDVLHWWP